MSSQLGSQVIASGSDSTFSVPSDGIKAILIGNESGLTCTITMESGGVSKTLYPSTLDWFQVNKGFNGTIRIHPYTILSNVATFPASSLIFDAISVSDPEQASMYPLQLTRNTNVGNSISTTLGTASAVQNDGSTSGTSVVEATVLGDSASAVSITNNGHVTFGSTTNNGQLEVIGASGNVTIKSTGEMDIDYKLLCNLIIAELGNDFTIDVATGHKIALQNNGSDMVDINGNGIDLVSGGFNPIMTPVSINGGTSGTAKCYQVMRGTIKMAFIVLANFKTAASNQTIAFPVAFTATEEIRSNDTEAFQLLSSGNPVTVRQMTAFGAAGVAGSTSPTATLNGFGYFWNGSAIDTIQFNSGWGSAHNGVIIIQGN
jgi:hypothetical protein